MFDNNLKEMYSYDTNEIKPVSSKDSDILKAILKKYNLNLRYPDGIIDFFINNLTEEELRNNQLSILELIRSIRRFGETVIQVYSKNEDILLDEHDNQVDEIIEIDEKLSKFIKYEDFYEDYGKIKDEWRKNNIGSFKDEKEYYFQRFSIDISNRVDFVFFVLVFRKKKERKFRNAFIDQNIPIDFKNISVEKLISLAHKFAYGYKDFLKRSKIFEPFFDDYGKILVKLRKKISQSFKEEKMFYENSFEFSDFNNEKFAFFILAFRNRQNKSFIHALYHNKRKKENNILKSLELLEEFEAKFRKAYENHIKEKTKK